jgi:hypothetical protein
MRPSRPDGGRPAIFFAGQIDPVAKYHGSLIPELVPIVKEIFVSRKFITPA